MAASGSDSERRFNSRLKFFISIKMTRTTFFFISWIMVFAGAGAGCRTSSEGTRSEGASVPVSSGSLAQCEVWRALSADDRRLADSLLTLALENEALYTLVGQIKPMSTIATLSIDVARRDTAEAGARSVSGQRPEQLDRIAQWQRAAEALRCVSSKVRIVFHPFRRADGGKRIIDVSVIHLEEMKAMIEREPSFWGQWGFVPSSSPEGVISVIENEERLERYRGYGYLFGYPEHAVTFFVEAARSEELTKQFVKRDFFQIPVSSGKAGHFVYAVPKGYAPTEADSALYRRATTTLSAYQARRSKYLRADSTLRALELLEEWYRTK